MSASNIASFNQPAAASAPKVDESIKDSYVDQSFQEEVMEEEEVIDEPVSDTRRKKVSLVVKPESSHRETFLQPDTAKEVVTESIGKEPSKNQVDESAADYEDPINDDYQEDGES